MEREQMALSVAPSQSARNMSDAGSPADFGKLIAKETETWGKEVKFAGLKPERSGNLAFHNFRLANAYADIMLWSGSSVPIELSR
jgi:hypothetical protein